ncbi:MAG: tannase/feruloyl esterase family alpha/beta hydrolase [Betaproteobacteria bacterium]|nr:MAG: tannase/feruloyl esterase family alpha/beta hydrolase [Betaproteobacteria bacterium]TMH57686.1 MAG: tannase/feruloyl esterase family alpha/beta hydrolase [Betaproteobacteria bacterium]
MPFGWTAQSLQRRSGRTSKNGRAWQNPWGSELNECVQTADPFAPPTPSKPFARPVCAYPQTAKYEGAGDGADAANWECVAR